MALLVINAEHDKEYERVNNVGSADPSLWWCSDGGRRSRRDEYVLTWLAKIRSTGTATQPLAHSRFFAVIATIVLVQYWTMLYSSSSIGKLLIKGELGSRLANGWNGKQQW